jgi:hypothetical protein
MHIMSKLAFSTIVIGLSIALFTFPYPSRQTFSITYPFSYAGKTIGKISESNPSSEIHQGRLTTIFWGIEVEEVPEGGISIVLGARISARDRSVTRTWSTIFSPGDELPINMLVELPLFLDDELDVPQGGSVEVQLTIFSEVESPGVDSEAIIGGGSGWGTANIINDGPVVDFFSENLFGIGLGILTIGVLAAAAQLTRARLFCRWGYHEWRDYGERVVVRWKEQQVLEDQICPRVGKLRKEDVVLSRRECLRCGRQQKRSFLKNEDGTWEVAGWKDVGVMDG